MYIEVEPTPNPDVRKFLPGRSVTDGEIRDFPSREALRNDSPLAERLFAIEGVQGVMFGGNFISVTRSAEAGWDELRTLVLGALMEHFDSGEPTVLEREGAPEEDSGGEDDEITARVKELLKLRVQPAVAMDGGDIQFHGFDRGVVYVTLRGACAGCPSATVTLKMGIENMLRPYIPERREVRTVA